MAPIVRSRSRLQWSGNSGFSTISGTISSLSLSDNSGGAEIRPSGEGHLARWGSVMLHVAHQLSSSSIYMLLHIPIYWAY